MKPELSIIIPAYERVDLLEKTVLNILEATQKIEKEIIIVDDGSPNPIEKSFSVNDSSIRIHRTVNQGSAAARCIGIQESLGDFVFLTDSDDKVTTDKFDLHLNAMRNSEIEITYSDQADDYHGAFDHHGKSIPAGLSIPELLIKQDIVSNNLIYCGDWLRRIIKNKKIPPRKVYGPAGDYWLYSNLLFEKGRAQKVEGPRSLHCYHDSEQITGCWEKLGISAQLLQDELLFHMNDFAEPEETTRLLSQAIFNSWRKLPYDMLPEFSDRKLEAWKKLPQLSAKNYGGKGFQIMALVLGFEKAGAVLRKRQRPGYKDAGTMQPHEFAKLFQEMLMEWEGEIANE